MVAGLVVVLAVCAAAYLTPSGKSAEDGPSEVLVLRWNDSLVDSIAAELSRVRVPVVIKESQVKEWRAMKLWTPEFISKKVSFLKSARNGSHPLFIGVSTKEGLMDASLLHQPDEQGRNYRLQDIRTKDFLAHDQASPKTQYHYYSGPMAWWPAELHSHVLPIDFLQVDRELAVASVWMSHKGVVAQCHFDRSYNFFVQIYGRKRWTLYPPENWALFYLYPHLHPNYHQSQVDHEHPDPQRFPHFSASNSLEAVLEPGDLLYVPPYWFHRVESLDTSISLSVISPSEEEVLYNRIQHFPLPFLPPPPNQPEDDETSDDEGEAEHDANAREDAARYESEWPMLPHRVIAARIYLDALVSQVIENREIANRFISEAVIERRYGPLADKLEPLADPQLVGALQRSDCFRNASIGRSYKALLEDWASKEVQVKKALRQAAHKQARLLRDVLSVSDGVGAIVLANHVEQVVNATVGWRNVLPFLRICTSFP